ncbi:hypothetical protein E4T66_20960 [Sinimarinibacterium sp. CAU 1509]|uniref:hypothetical protein n=1 Tax=Sinimarinibacterium sp. CAU 1509 TaxID=2562283 RepID=UPI0010AC074D|nr:hypothetical protein [Sinimarinibacterium sp. CAU 1509]TJY55415.1 hypothetical protein E4T66_20960 [Sinimarinibacterium sp. CAU 1509]
MRPNHYFPFVALALSAMAVLLPSGPAHSAESHHAHSATTASVVETNAAMRDLWLGHVFWVRNVVESTLSDNSAAAKAAEEQVVANAKQIASAIEPFYGKEASDKLFGLLAGHYGAIKDYLAAQTPAAQDRAWTKIAANAGEIAVFLSGANPNLPVDTLRGLLAAHGGHHVQQIQQLRAKDYAAEARTWDAMKQHMYVIADALTGAIAKQFPAKFA